MSFFSTFSTISFCFFFAALRFSLDGEYTYFGMAWELGVTPICERRTVSRKESGVETLDLDGGNTVVAILKLKLNFFACEGAGEIEQGKAWHDVDAGQFTYLQPVTSNFN